MGRWERQFRRRHGMIPTVRMRQRMEMLGKLEAFRRAMQRQSTSKSSLLSRLVGKIRKSRKTPR